VVICLPIFFAYDPADAFVSPKPHLLLFHLNPDWFYLSGTALPRLSWRIGRKTGVVVVVVVLYNDVLLLCLG